jgi:hypothetical protein
MGIAIYADKWPKDFDPSPYGDVTETSPARRGGRDLLRVWSVKRSAGGGIYDVEERNDSKTGGKYLYCPCPGWKFGVGVNRDCRHVSEVRLRIQAEEAKEWK